jgi:hypothetical protein
MESPGGGSWAVTMEVSRVGSPSGVLAVDGWRAIAAALL